MRYVAIAGCATLAFLGVIGQPALAHQNWHESPLVKLHNNVSIAGGATYQHYKEFSHGNWIDKETGWLPNIKASASYMSPNKHYLLSVGVRYSFGKSTHKGAYKTKTKNQIVSVNGKVGRGFRVSNRFMVTSFATYGHRYWHRNIESTPAARGPTENYNLNYVGAGVMVDYRATKRLMLSAQGMGAGTFDNTMTTPAFPVNFGLGSEPLAKAALKADYHVRGNWHVFGTVHYTYFRFGHSKRYTFQYNGQTAHAHEPNSTTQNVSMDVGIRYTF